MTSSALLPSREAFPPRRGPVLYHMAEQKLIVDAYHSGRLVDREAIDRKAAADQLGLEAW